MTASFPNSVKSFGADRVDGEYIPASDMNDLRAEVVAVETTALDGGWIGSSGWLYLSASTFSVPGDVSAVFVKGTRLKWVQTSLKYGVVVSSVYAAGVTTVTIFITSDYILANAAISQAYFSQLAQPAGFPDWFSWSPTWTGFTVGNATVTAKYAVLGAKLFYNVYVSLGSTSAVTGDVSLTMPAATVRAPIGLANLIDASSGIGYYGVGNMSGALCYVRVMNAAGTYMVHSVISATVPFAWTSPDGLRVGGWYEW